MEKYESRQQQIRRPAEQIYSVISDFNNFTPVVQGHVEDWMADETSCSFKVKGMTMRLRMVDKVPNDYVKVTGDERSPLDFTFWIQLKQVGDYDTRMRLVLHAKLNMVMKMMIGSKLQQGLDQMAEQMAKAVVRSPLVKCAVFGTDANWGRVLCAIGYSGAQFDPKDVEVKFLSRAGELLVCAGGQGVAFDEALAKQVLSEDEVVIQVTLTSGSATCSCWGCDLTYDYVKINGDYRS